MFAAARAIALLAAIVASHTGPDEPGGVYVGTSHQVHVRVPRLETDIRVDGQLDEPVWRQAAVLTGFSQFSPQDGVAADDSTQVLVWYSATAIHFGIRAFERHGAPVATLADRDRIDADDQVQILLGTFNDGRQALVFGVTLDVLVEERLVERSADLGEILLSGLRAIKSPVVREVRGLGLFSGIDIDPAWASAREVAMRLLARRILTRDTHHTVVRVAPPLVIDRTQLEWALKNIRSVLAEIERGFKRAA